MCPPLLPNLFILSKMPSSSSFLLLIVVLRYGFSHTQFSGFFSLSLCLCLCLFLSVSATIIYYFYRTSAHLHLPFSRVSSSSPLFPPLRLTVCRKNKIRLSLGFSPPPRPPFVPDPCQVLNTCPLVCLFCFVVVFCLVLFISLNVLIPLSDLLCLSRPLPPFPPLRLPYLSVSLFFSILNDSPKNCFLSVC